MSLTSTTTPDLDEILWKKFTDFLDRFKKQITTESKFVTRRLYAQQTSTGAGTMKLVLSAGDQTSGGPASGKLWCVQFIALFGVNDYSPVANFTGAAVYIAGDSDAPTSSQVVFPGLGSVTAPGYNDFTDRTIWQYPSEDLTIAVTVSGVATAKATAMVKEYNLCDIQPGVI